MVVQNSPIRTGVALSVTVALAYTACALFFQLFPTTAVAIANAVFHGVDFGKIQTAGGAFELSSFVLALLVLVAWSFILGMLFEWLRNLSSRSR